VAVEAAAAVAQQAEQAAAASADGDIGWSNDENDQETSQQPGPIQVRKVHTGASASKLQSQAIGVCLTSGVP
jgi:hypothetical protein